MRGGYFRGSGQPGATAKNNRLFVDAVLYRYRAGIPWRDLPARFGDFRVVHTRHSRWSRTGVWQRVFEALAQDADNEYSMIDSTIVRAHQHSAYDAHARLIKPLLDKGKIVVIPSRVTNRQPREHDRDLYKARHLIENFFARLKQYRAIATRYDKTACNFLGAVYLAAAMVWLA